VSRRGRWPRPRAGRAPAGERSGLRAPRCSARSASARTTRALARPTVRGSSSAGTTRARLRTSSRGVHPPARTGRSRRSAVPARTPSAGTTRARLTTSSRGLDPPPRTVILARSQIRCAATRNKRARRAVAHSPGSTNLTKESGPSRAGPPEASGLGRWMDAPRGEPTGLSWGSAAFRGHGSHRPWMVIGSIRPVRRFDAPRAHFDATSRAAEATRGPSVRFPAPSEAFVAAPHGPADPWAGASDHATSPGLRRPFDTFSERWSVTTAVPPAARPAVCEVWLPPARPLQLSSRRAKRRSVHGLPPSGRPPRARWYPLSGALPSCRCRPSRRTVRCTRGRGRLQGFVLGTGSFGHRPLRVGRRCPPGVPPFRAFAPSVRAQRFGRAASPRTPLAG
jgi:hypothetical protein